MVTRVLIGMIYECWCLLEYLLLFYTYFFIICMNICHLNEEVILNLLLLFLLVCHCQILFSLLAHPYLSLLPFLFTSELQILLPKCLLQISTWMSLRHTNSTWPRLNIIVSPNLLPFQFPLSLSNSISHLSNHSKHRYGAPLLTLTLHHQPSTLLLTLQKYLATHFFPPQWPLCQQFSSFIQPVSIYYLLGATHWDRTWHMIKVSETEKAPVLMN